MRAGAKTDHRRIGHHLALPVRPMLGKVDTTPTFGSVKAYVFALTISQKLIAHDTNAPARMIIVQFGAPTLRAHQAREYAGCDNP